jgi:hypothetical protein
VHQVSVFDSWRAPQFPQAAAAPEASDLIQIS